MLSGRLNGLKTLEVWWGGEVGYGICEGRLGLLRFRDFIGKLCSVLSIALSILYQYVDSHPKPTSSLECFERFEKLRSSHLKSIMSSAQSLFFTCLPPLQHWGDPLSEYQIAALTLHTVAASCSVTFPFKLKSLLSSFIGESRFSIAFFLIDANPHNAWR